MKPRLASIVVGILFCATAGTATIWAQEESGSQQQAADEQSGEDRGVRRLGDVIGESGSDFSMDIPQIEMPAEPVAEQPEVTLPDAQLDAQLQDLLSRRAFAPDDPEIANELAGLLDEAAARARQALDDDDTDLAAAYAGVITEFDPQHPVIDEVAAQRERLAEVERLLALADAALEADTLLEPAPSSARVLYRQTLELDPENAAAQAGLDTVRQRLLARVDDFLEAGEFEPAATTLDVVADMEAAPEAVDNRREAIARAREQRRESLIADTRDAIDSGNFDRAETLINELIGMGLAQQRVDRLRDSLDDAIRYSGFEPGQRFQDSLEGMEGYGPMMAVIPSGSFMMGSPEEEDGRVDNEGPRFRVTFERGFALSRTEVTVGQFRRFVEATGYVTDAERSGRSRIYLAGSGRITERQRVTWEENYMGEPADESMPVIHVSWNDAAAYAEWLAEQTDRPYRLPTEAEFEYALRAGSQTPYWWGEGSPEQAVENVTGDGDEFIDQRTWTNAFRRYTDDYWGPAPAGSLVANPFGLFDMGGNVMEWVQDCWHDGYVRAPDDGSAWVNPGCERRVIRGASWSSTPAMSRSAFRISSRDTATDARVGFRVARDL